MKILSLNVRGLHYQVKRQLFFKKFEKYDICCIQEAYIVPDLAEVWMSEWPGQFFYYPGTSNSGGLIILINKHFHCAKIQTIEINDRILGISLTQDENTHTRVLLLVEICSCNNRS